MSVTAYMLSFGVFTLLERDKPVVDKLNIFSAYKGALQIIDL